MGEYVCGSQSVVYYTALIDEATAHRKFQNLRKNVCGSIGLMNLANILMLKPFEVLFSVAGL